MEGGHPNYQHPGRTLRFDENIDAFSALVITTALVSLSIKPDLWKSYDKGNNLLFQQSDFKDTDKSPLFTELEKIKDATLQQLLGELVSACNVKNTSQIKPIEEIFAFLK